MIYILCQSSHCNSYIEQNTKASTSSIQSGTGREKRELYMISIPRAGYRPAHALGEIHTEMGPRDIHGFTCVLSPINSIPTKL